MPLNPSYLVAAFAVISESKDPEGLGLDEMAARGIPSFQAGNVILRFQQ